MATHLTESAMSGDAPARELERGNFYRIWLTRAFREAFSALGFENRGEMMRGLVLWAIAVIALYRIPWRGWPIIGTIDAEPAHEVRFGLCVVIAIVIVFFLSLCWQLVVQPVRLHREACRTVDDLETLVVGIGDAEADRVFLSEARQEGFRLYRTNVNCDDPQSVQAWSKNMDEWVEKVRSHLSARWSVSAMHDSNDLGSMGGFHYRRGEGDRLEAVKDDHGFSILCGYSAYLRSVDDIVRHGEHKHLGDVDGILRARDFRRLRNEAPIPPTPTTYPAR